MTKPKTTKHCWIVRHGDDDKYADERHYLTEQDARDEAQDSTDNGEPATAERLPAPCITVACEGCGYWVDEDDEGIIHFESHDQARKYVLGTHGEDAVFSGDVLVQCCADCPGNEPDGGRS